MNLPKIFTILIISVINCVACAQEKKITGGAMEITNEKLRSPTIGYLNYLDGWSNKNNFHKYVVGLMIDNRKEDETSYHLGIVTNTSFFNENYLIGYTKLNDIPILIFSTDTLIKVKGSTKSLVRKNYYNKLFDDVAFNEKLTTDFKEKNKGKDVIIPNFSAETTKTLNATSKRVSKPGKKVKKTSLRPLARESKSEILPQFPESRKITLPSDEVVF